ncbi:hypothetical protein GB927_019140 [Shinella sp. CPCC 100929]|uniref:Uncharacterized protein n=1 Tax=Shinella lacus TaxID=2654216 RepID=A0ABT1RAE9_9HYPH|nr:hypothetical protein [Shinella lacus]MCQ4632174.1 hypothetical protein [Shinella lacus]
MTIRKIGTTQKTGTRPASDLANRYNPIGIRAVAAAALQVKVKHFPGK